MMDENVKMTDEDIAKFPNCVVLNSTNYFNKGASDELLTTLAKKKGWTIVTKDIRMALRSLIVDVPILYVSDEFKQIYYLTVDLYGRNHYPEMFDYIQKRFHYDR